jgi:hypothetical protein
MEPDDDSQEWQRELSEYEQWEQENDDDDNE